MSARRRQVWLADFDPVEGHEPSGRRPALVLSVDSFNASRADLVTVLPMTSRARPNNPFRVEVRPPEGGLSAVSYVIGEQTRTVSIRRLVKVLGTVSESTMTKVADVVCVVLGL
jgi:mRNA interferase MazF